MDTTQLGSHASGLTKVTVILACHPEWDCPPWQLKLPVISRVSGKITTKADHINPTSWHSNVEVSKVNLQTCWILSHQKAIKIVLEAGAVLEHLGSTPGIDILSPLGDILVNIQDADDEYDCSEVADMYGSSEAPLNDSSVPVAGALTLPVSTVSVPHTHEEDMEDAISEEVP